MDEARAVCAAPRCHVGAGQSDQPNGNTHEDDEDEDDSDLVHYIDSESGRIVLSTNKAQQLAYLRKQRKIERKRSRLPGARSEITPNLV